ncbi:MAG: hypothetical protein FWF82_01535 [Oscillospiraceae bacterium]|nr:hypothetical protein [Oscillospiraceae bacterium]
MIMILVTIFLITLSIMFSGAKNAPDFFGSSLYLAKSDFSDLLPKSPCVVVGEKAVPDSLGAGDIVIFEAAGIKSLGKITEKIVPDSDIEGEGEGEPESFTVKFAVNGESGQTYEVAESEIVAKAVKTSRTLGIIVNFAMSPAGVLVIAIIPCLCLILLELLKPLFRRGMDRGRVVPVNKQEETPTFVPLPEPDLFSPLIKEEVKESETTKQEKPAKSPTVAAVSEESPRKETNSVAALRAYKQTLAQTVSLGDTIDGIGQPGLFVNPEKPKYEKPTEFIPEAVKPKPEPQSHKKKPLSSVKLAEVIASVNAQKAQQAKQSQNFKEESHDN